ncbi:MAG: FG-GAP-like repeat-containing protein [Flavobacteriales bacterium]
MNRILLLIPACVGALVASAQNTCATALAVGAGTHLVVGIDGTQIPIPLCATGGTGATGAEWYSYTPAADHGLTITTDLVQNMGGDTRFHVYTGVCGNLACLSGDDDGGSGNLSTATFNVQQGVTYHFAFDDRHSDAGFVFELIEGPVLQAPVGFTTQALPSSSNAMCVVDMNNDQLDDVVSTSTSTIQVNYQQQGGGFVATNIPTPSADFPASWSIAAGDLDANGQIDFVYGAGSGVTIMEADANGTSFTEISGPEYVFSQRTNMVDINNDGHLDVFVCHDVDPNVYYINDGFGNFTFMQGGLGDTQVGGNYGSIWIDYDNDHDIDLFIAKCGSDPIDQLHRNNGNGTFTEIGAAMNLAGTQQSWSSAWGDFDRDGDMDVMIGNSSGGAHKLMRNDGSIFTNVTTGSGFDTFTGTQIEHTTHDFDNDGWLDVLGANSTIMVNNHDMTFTPVVAGFGNGGVGDLNNDGYLDLASFGNIYLNNGGVNNWLRVNTVGTVSNKNGIGARVVLTSAGGTQIRDVKSGDGFKYMSSLLTHFGLGSDQTVDDVTVYWPSGIVNTITNVGINSTITITEDAITSVAPPPTVLQLSIGPVPATNELFIRTNTNAMNAPVAVFDVAGKQVMSTELTSDRLDVAALQSGVYVLQVLLNGRTEQRRFVKG